MVDGVTSLLDKSLLTRVESPRGERRFGMLDVVREYAADVLSKSGEYDRVARAHA